MKLEKHIEFLKDRVDPEFGLLDKLLSGKVVPKRIVDEIKSAATLYDKNDILLDYVTTSKKEKLFLATLTKDNQEHIVNYIESDGKKDERFGYCWPLTEKQIYTLDANLESLVDRINAVDCGFVVKLYSENVINLRQRECIQSQQESFKKNDKFLDILRRRSLQDYNTTISCFKETNQGHIAVLLERGGMTAELDIKLIVNKSDDVDTETAEKIVRDFLKNELESTPSEDSRAALQDIPEDLLEESKRYITDMMKRLSLKDARIGDSIILSFHCGNIGDFRNVKEELTGKHIEDMFLKLYRALLAKKEVNVKVQWHKASYKQCQNYFQDEDDDGLFAEDDDEIMPCEDDLLFKLSKTQLRKRFSRIESPKFCYYPTQEHVASLVVKRLQFIFKYYHNGRKLEDFKDFDFRIYTAGSKMLQEQTRRRLCDKDAGCLPLNAYGSSDVLKYLSKEHVKTYRLTKETTKDLNDLVADAIANPNKLFVIIADEAHFGVSEGGRGRELINTWCHENHPNVIVLLVTATPEIFFRERTSSRIPCISVAEARKDGEFIVVKVKDELRHKKVIKVETGIDVSKEVGPVKELHVFRWNECWERRFEEGLVVTLRVPQRFLKNREQQIWLSVEDFSDNKLSPVIGKTNEKYATPFLLRERNNTVQVTNLDESKTLVVMRSSGQAKSYEVGFLPNEDISGKGLPLSFSFKVLMNVGEDVLELEVLQENGSLGCLKYTYAKSKLELGRATTDASKLDSSMTYQFLIDSYRNRGDDESGPQYLSLNFYYNSIRNHAREEQLIRTDMNFEDMASKFKPTPADHLLVAEYAYYIVSLDCLRKATPKTNTFQEFIREPNESWKEYLDLRKIRLDALKSSLQINSENVVRPIESSCFAEVVKHTEEKAWQELHGVCKRIEKQKDLKQDDFDDLYEALTGYLLHANQESFTRNMETVKSAVERYMPDLLKITDNFKNNFCTKMISVLCRNETFRIVNDMIQIEDEKDEQRMLNGHMKVIRASCTEMANMIYATLILARKVANRYDDCFFEIIRYFLGFTVSDHETKGPNSRIWQILQPEHCTSYSKKPLQPCRCESYDPKDNELECKNCSHLHHSVKTFFDLDRLPCIVIVVEMGRMGDTFPPSLNVMDLRARRPIKLNVSSLIQEVGRICRYQKKSSYSDFPYVLVGFKVMKMLEGNLHNSVSFYPNINLIPKNEPNGHHNRLLLIGGPQIGKTGVFLNMVSQLRKLIKGPDDNFDLSIIAKAQTTRKRSANANGSQTCQKRENVSENQTQVEKKDDKSICDLEDNVQKAEADSECKSKTEASAKQYKFFDLLHCSICNKMFVDPRNLPCRHSFCLKCIQQVFDARLPKAVLTCPLCSKEFLFPDDGCEGLAENTFLKRLVDMASRPVLELCDYLESLHSNSEAPVAVLFCEQCEEKLCKGCEVIHTVQGHKMLPLEKHHLYRSPIEFCSVHNNRRLDIYCKDCGITLCLSCLKEHNGHTCSDIIAIVDDYRKSLKMYSQLMEVAKEDMRKNIHRMEKQLTLNRRSIELIQKQSAEIEARKAEFERHLPTIEHCTKYCQELADKGTVKDVLRETEGWQKKTDEIKGYHKTMDDIQIPIIDDALQAAIAECSFLEERKL